LRRHRAAQTIPDSRTKEIVAMGQNGGASSQQRWTLVAVCVATFMLLVDITIVNVGLPSIQRDLKSGLSGLQWVVDAYAISLAGLILTAGVLADRFGKRLVFMSGVTIFTAASLLCGLASSSVMLDVARALQGVGGAAMFATGLALIAQEFSGPERVRAIAAWGSTVGVAVAAGPLLGGVLTQGLGWRWIFFVNVPVGLVALGIARTRVADRRGATSRSVDAAGLVAFSLSLFLVIYGLLRGNDSGWSSAVIVATLACGAGLLVAFIAIERRVKQPMLDLSLFRQPAFVGVSLATFAIGAGMFAMFLYLSIYLQGVLDYGPLAAGLRLLPTTLMVLAVPLLTRSVAVRVSPQLMLVPGLLLISCGLFLMRAISVGSSWTVMLPGLILAGVGIGLANPAIAALAVGVVDRERSGMASGINNTFRLGGLATGVAGLGAIFQHAITQHLGTHAHLGAAVASGGTRSLAGKQPADVVLAANRAFVAAMHEILLVGGVLVLGGALAAWVLIRGFRPATTSLPGVVERRGVAADPAVVESQRAVVDSELTRD
jgi:EmrB/QacA subfamily drug resistance transporter